MLFEEVEDRCHTLAPKVRSRPRGEGEKESQVISDALYTETIIHSLPAGKQGRGVVSNAIHIEHRIHLLPGCEKGMKVVSDRFHTEDTVHTHWRRQGKRVASNGAPISQFTHGLEVREGGKQ